MANEMADERPTCPVSHSPKFMGAPMSYLIEILLPTNFECGRQDLEEITSILVGQFGGVTIHEKSAAHGLWTDNGRTEFDRITFVEVMADEVDRDWWNDYRRILELRLSQSEIVVRFSKIERL